MDHWYERPRLPLVKCVSVFCEVVNVSSETKPVATFVSHYFLRMGRNIIQIETFPAVDWICDLTGELKEQRMLYCAVKTTDIDFIFLSETSSKTVIGLFTLSVFMVLQTKFELFMSGFKQFLS